MKNETEEPAKMIRIIQIEDFDLDLEYEDDFIALHLPRMTRLNKKNYFKLRKVVDELTDLVKTMGYVGLWAALDDDQPLMKKLVIRLGFEYIERNEEMDLFLKQ
jgi:hypothetical protein